MQETEHNWILINFIILSARVNMSRLGYIYHYYVKILFSFLSPCCVLFREETKSKMLITFSKKWLTSMEPVCCFLTVKLFVTSKWENMKKQKVFFKKL